MSPDLPPLLREAAATLPIEVAASPTIGAAITRRFGFARAAMGLALEQLDQGNPAEARDLLRGALAIDDRAETARQSRRG
jgi:Tfp pilus assembly protein PilF